MQPVWKHETIMNPIVRKLSIVGALVLLFGAAIATQALMKKKEPPKRKAAEKEIIRDVEVFAVKNGPVLSTLAIQGSLTAFNKIDLFTEVTGVLTATSKPFKVGSYFKKGEVLLRIDDQENRLALLSQKSSLLNGVAQLMPDLKIDYPESFPQWKAYLDAFDVSKGIALLPEPINEQEKFFIATKNLHTQYYNIKSAENRLGKYTITAPFSGVLTMANIHPGSLVRSGQNMGTLMNTGNYELEATVSMADLLAIKPGSTVKLASEDIPGVWQGRVKRISDQIDANTQTALVFISVSGKDLREGMYMNGMVNAKKVNDALEIPRDLLVDQQGVYTIQRDSFLKIQPVEVLRISQKEAIVKGVPNGTLLLKKQISGAFEGMKVNAIEVETALSKVSINQ